MCACIQNTSTKSFLENVNAHKECQIKIMRLRYRTTNIKLQDKLE